MQLQFPSTLIGWYAELVAELPLQHHAKQGKELDTANNVVKPVVCITVAPCENRVLHVTLLCQHVLHALQHLMKKRECKENPEDCMKTTYLV
jgi:hypothetical protein